MDDPPQPPRTILEALASWAADTPHAVALLSPERGPVTYRELHSAVARLAQGLRALGLGRGDGIALLLPEGPELCLALLAVMSAGIAVPLAWPAQVAEYGRVLANWRVRAVLAPGAIQSPSLACELADYRLPTIVFAAGASGAFGEVQIDGTPIGSPGPVAAPDSDDVAVIFQSSGTTGRPKLAPRLHRNLVAMCRAVIAARAMTPADRHLSLAKMTHAQGTNVLLNAVYAGSSVVSVPGPDLAALPHWLREFRPTCVATGPTTLRAMAADRGVRDALRHVSPRFIQTTGSTLSTAEADKLESALGVRLLNGYGLTEAAFIADDPYPERHRVPGSVGLVRCETRILEEAGSFAAQGECGEIVVRGPRVFPGYLDDPAANAAAFLPGGWFRTGDLGFIDREGFLHLTGRLGEIINRGGEKIAPGDVDDVLLAHPAVADAAVFAVPDSLLGEDVVAAVVLMPGVTVTPMELRVWMLDRLIAYKVPRRIWFVTGLPKTPTGKVQRGELSRRWLEGHG